MRMQTFAALALGAAAFGALAQAPPPVLARAAALQPPVWVERDGSRSALRAGAALRPGDRFETGAGARLHIELEDASTIKLGENAAFQLPSLAIVDDGADAGLLKGALQVVKGAFRFTTSALGALRRRELDVQIGPTVTAGIRGTDIWGKSDDARDLVCLLEGKIEVSSPGAPVQVMDQPRTFYVVPRGGAPLPIVPTPEDKLAGWAAQTELVADQAALNASGRWRIVLASFGSQGQAQRELERLAALGYGADVLAVADGGATRHRVVLSGLATKTEAQAYARSLKARGGFGAPWVLAP